MTRAITIPARLVLTAFAVSLAVLVVTQPGALSTSAYHEPGMRLLSIDMQESATPANTSSALGTREVCTRINENNVMDADEDVVDGLKIDITATDVPAYDDNGTPDYSDYEDDSGGIIAFQYALEYSVANLTVAAHEYNNSAVNLLQRNPGSTLFDQGDPVPDDNFEDGWYANVADDATYSGTPTSTPEDGSGVLGRLTVITEPLAQSGIYPLTINPINDGYYDASGHAHEAEAIQNAFVAINTGCDDYDLDGIPNEQDQCATAPGPASNNGCQLSSTPRPPAVGGTAGLLDARDSSGHSGQLASTTAIAGIAVLASVGGGMLIRRLALRRQR
jgi:hypothetical protein